jgi:hypothetical protein
MNALEMEPGLSTIMSGGPLAGPEAEPGTQPAMIIDLMGEGSVIEKDPAPVASIIASQPAAEAILQRMFGPSPEEAADEDTPAGERFVPYALTGDPAEIFGGITVIGQDPESLASANAFVRKLLGSIERPEEDEASAAPETVIHKDDQADPESGLGRNLLTAFRRSRLAKTVAGGAVVVAGALSWPSSAEASNMVSTTPEAGTTSITPFAVLSTRPTFGEDIATASDDSLAQQCIQAGLVTPDVLVAKMYAAGRPAQTVKGIFHEDAMPDGCAGQYDRYLSLRFLLQNAEHRNRWTYLDPGEISTWQKGGELLDGAFTSGPAITQNVHNKKDDYQCSPQKSHKYDTRVKGETKNIVEDAAGHVVGGPVLNTFQVKVYFPC